MKKYVLTFCFMIMSMFMTSCMTTEELTYSDVYISGTISYPVRWINEYPYYWFNNHWTIVPTYRYRYIRPLDRPRRFYAPNPSPRRYDYRYYPNRPKPRVGGPHTQQPTHRPSHHGNNHNNNHQGHFGGRR